jgi:phosphoesterase RecJ-like protein
LRFDLKVVTLKFEKQRNILTWKDNIPALRTMLNGAKRALIVSHTNPDGDAVGASLGMWHYLHAAYPETEVRVVFPNKFPDFLAWIDGAKEAMIYSDGKDVVKAYLGQCDLVICLDFNSLSRLDNLCPELASCAAPRILIDHHLQPADEFSLVFSDVSMSSTAEFVYRIVVALGDKHKLTKAAAEALYVGLVTDTGSFSFSVYTPETFRMAADMMEFGIDKNAIAIKVYDSYSQNRMRLLGYCLQKKLCVLPEYKAAYISLSRRELENFDFQVGDTEGFVNLPLSIKGIELSALLTEALDRTHIRVSLRSRGSNISVNELARAKFNGGGHFSAAGGKFFKSLRECELYFEKVLKECF